MTESLRSESAARMPARSTYVPAAAPVGAATLTSQSSIALGATADGAIELTVVQPAGSVMICVMAIESVVLLTIANGAVNTPPGVTDPRSLRDERTVIGADCARAEAASITSIESRAVRAASRVGLITTSRCASTGYSPVNGALQRRNASRVFCAVRDEFTGVRCAAALAE